MSSNKNEKTGAGQSTPATAVKKVGTPKTEQIIGTAAMKLTKAAAEIKESFDIIDKLVGAAEEVTLEITNKESKLALLDTEYAEKKRAYQVQNELDFREDRVKHVQSYLDENKMTMLTAADHTKLVSMAANNEKALKDAVSAAEAIVGNTLKRNYEADKRVMEAEFQTKEAANVAKIASLTTELLAAKAEAGRWEAALTAERAAGVERSKASAVGAVNIGQPNSR